MILAKSLCLCYVNLAMFLIWLTKHNSSKMVRILSCKTVTMSVTICVIRHVNLVCRGSILGLHTIGRKTKNQNKQITYTFKQFLF